MTKKHELNLSDQVSEFLEAQASPKDDYIERLLQDEMKKAREMSWQAKETLSILAEMKLKPGSEVWAQTFAHKWMSRCPDQTDQMEEGLQELVRRGVLDEKSKLYYLTEEGYRALQ